MTQFDVASVLTSSTRTCTDNMIFDFSGCSNLNVTLKILWKNYRKITGVLAGPTTSLRIEDTIDAGN